MQRLLCEARKRVADAFLRPLPWDPMGFPEGVGPSSWSAVLQRGLSMSSLPSVSPLQLPPARCRRLDTLTRAVNSATIEASASPVWLR